MARGSNRVIYGHGGNRTYFINDMEVTEAEWHARFPSRIEDLLAQGVSTKSMTPGKWPIASEALAVHKDQIPEAIETAKQKGVPTTFDKDGRPLMTSPEHFQQYANAHGFKHRGY